MHNFPKRNKNWGEGPILSSGGRGAVPPLHNFEAMLSGCPLDNCVLWFDGIYKTLLLVSGCHVSGLSQKKGGACFFSLGQTWRPRPTKQQLPLFLSAPKKEKHKFLLKNCFCAATIIVMNVYLEFVV
jgi:hypothetical protein